MEDRKLNLIRMKKSSNESEKLDMSDPNIYLKVFNDKVKINEKISMDSIEVVLSNMTNLHNTIGKSYEVVATSTLFYFGYHFSIGDTA